MNVSSLACSFCGKPQHEVLVLIAGPNVFICDECTEMCMDIVQQHGKTPEERVRDAVANMDWSK